jgi:hypothetical protein
LQVFFRSFAALHLWNDVIGTQIGPATAAQAGVPVALKHG